MRDYPPSRPGPPIRDGRSTRLVILFGLTASPVAGSRADWSRRDSDALASAWSTSARGGARGVILGASAAHSPWRCRRTRSWRSTKTPRARPRRARSRRARPRVSRRRKVRAPRAMRASVGGRRSHGGEWEFDRAFTRSGRRRARANPRTRATRREKQCADEGKPQSRADDD